MLYEGIRDMIESNEEAACIFNALPQDVQQTLLESGTGINTVDELINFKSTHTQK